MAQTIDRPVERRAISTAADERRLRPDIQALRALAVGVVILYHLWPHRLTGGYVGVDVFFVISGYLITAHLLGEVERTGRLSLSAFWARRAKRLVPASTLTLLATSAGILLVVPRLLWRQFFGEVVASTLLVQNWRLAHDSVDYLAASNSASPVQHLWTLSVEEQFYIAVPVLLVGSLALTRIKRLRFRTVAVLVLWLTLFASFAYSVWLTSTTPGVAYFSTGTRAWEFAVGGILAFLPKRSRHASRVRTWLPWLGIAAIAFACLRFNGATAFPGAAAALPVLGTALAIRTGQHTSWARLGEVRWVAMLGRTSYAAYLWHWPLVVLVPFATGRPLGTADKLLIIAATVALAWVSTTLVEEPIRFRPALLGRRRPRVVFAWCAVPMAVVLTIAISSSQREVNHERHLTAVSQRVLDTGQRCLGAQAMDPRLAPCTNPELNGLLIPDPSAARADDANVAACWGSHRICSLGPTTGYRKRLFAVGDSHNNALIGVYRYIAETNNWRIDVAGNAGCYITEATQNAPSDGAQQSCASWRQFMIASANSGHYDAIIMTHSDFERQVVPPAGETLQQATVDGMVRAWNELPNVPIIAIRDNPSVPNTTLACVDEHRSTAATACAVPRALALGYPDGAPQAVQQVPRAHLIDLSSFYCTATVCPPVIGHVLVYRDRTHLTGTFARTLAPYINQQVTAILGR